MARTEASTTGRGNTAWSCGRRHTGNGSQPRRWELSPWFPREPRHAFPAIRCGTTGRPKLFSGACQAQTAIERTNEPARLHPQRLVRLHPREDSFEVSHGRTVFSTNLKGFVVANTSGGRPHDCVEAHPSGECCHGGSLYQSMYATIPEHVNIPELVLRSRCLRGRPSQSIPCLEREMEEQIGRHH